jgi:glycosyltransferase involved in cell wall biosynthesis/uncharacterized membrane protein YbhN (UPF0104 family)
VIPLRVLHVTSTYPRADGEPTGLFMADLVSAQVAAGLQVSVLAPHDAGLAADAEIGGAPVHRFRYGPDALEILSYRGGLLASARRPLGILMVPGYVVAMIAATVTATRRHIDVIHAHWWFPGGLAAVVASRLVGVPFIVTLHGSDVALARRRPLRPLARAVLRRAAAVTAVSQALAVEAAAVLGLPPGSIVVLAMPIVAPKAVPPPLAPPPIRVVAVGRLAPEKGFDVLVAAVSRLGDEGVSVEVEIVGDGPERDRLMATGRRLGVALELPGRLGRADLYARMAAAHVVAVPSRREGLGLAAVEALALGRPVVASRVGGLVETVEDGVDGLLVAPDDPGALAAALKRCPLPVPVGRAVERHRPDACAAAHSGLYGDVAGEAVPRWRPLRWLGALTAVAVVAVLLRLAGRDWPAIRHAWRHPDVVFLGLAVAGTLVAEIGFGLASALALAAVAGRPAPAWRVASVFWVSQTAKNVPGGLWTALARAGLAAEWGVGGRATLGWLATEGLASCTAGTVVGGVALAVAPARLAAGVWVLVAAAGASIPLVVGSWSPLARLVTRLAGACPTPTQVGRAAVAYVPVWLISAAAFAALCRAIVPLHGSDLLVVGGAACVASIAGFVAVPVPSGLGVREAVLVALLHPVMPVPLGASVVLASRLLAVLAQTGLAVVVLPSVRARPGGPRAGPPVGPAVPTGR